MPILAVRKSNSLSLIHYEKDHCSRARLLRAILLQTRKHLRRLPERQML